MRGKARRFLFFKNFFMIRLGRTHRLLCNKFNIIFKRIGKYGFKSFFFSYDTNLLNFIFRGTFISIYGLLGVLYKLKKKIFKRGKLSSYR
jgi:hypothetical protein